MSPEAIGPGILVLVVGPSGAGKDALLSGAAERLAGQTAFVFPNRMVTRHANAAEDHDTIARDAFDAGVKTGAFALHWEAHGLGYAVPKSIDDAIANGCVVVLNGSRGILSDARVRYRNVQVILITAPESVRRARILARGREGAEEVDARLKRSVGTFSAGDAHVVLENTGTVDEGIAQLNEVLSRLSRQVAPQPA